MSGGVVGASTSGWLGWALTAWFPHPGDLIELRLYELPGACDSIPRAIRPAPEATALEIWLLGGFRVASCSRSVAADEWRRKKVSGLVKLLALSDGRLHRDQLLDALWPDLPSEAAANNLYQTLYTTRRLLGSTDTSARSYLQIRSDIVHLVLDGDVWIDVIAFRMAAKAARASDDVADYRAALALYAGDLLPEDVSEEWTKEPRTTLRREYVALLLGLAKQEEVGHEADAAIQSLQRVVEADPAHEEANARLMRLYASRGERQRALRQYQSLVDHLREELGAAPDPRTEQLHQAILAGRFPKVDPVPRRRTDASPRKPHNLPNQLTRFIGRAHALAEVQRLLSAGVDVVALVTACPPLRILATSREPLHVYGEREFAVRPVDAPDPERSVSPGTSPTASAAARLFVERARAAHRDFTVAEETATIVLSSTRIPLSRFA